MTAGASPPWWIRPARVDAAEALTALCRRSKAFWGYDARFMALAGPALRVTPEAIAAGDVWVAEDDGTTAGVVALAAAVAPGTATLDLLYVAPESLRRGISEAPSDAGIPGRMLPVYAIDCTA